MIVYNELDRPIFISEGEDRGKGTVSISPGQGIDLAMLGLMPPRYPYVKLTPAREKIIRATLASHIRYSRPDCPQSRDYQKHLPELLGELEAIRESIGLCD